MKDLAKYSGLATVFVAWISLVIPYFIYGKKYKLATISETVKVNKFLEYWVNVGIFIASSTQIIFIYFLQTRFGQINKLGLLIYLAGTICYMLSSVFTERNNKVIHQYLIKLYFASLCLGLSLISYSLLKVDILGAILSLVSIFIMAFGAILLFRRGKPSGSEIWTIVFANLWAIFLYIFIIG
jgi:hypothetical protein